MIEKKLNLNDVTVVIATNNRSKQLNECLVSLINSSESPKEIIVVDQSSNSETEKLSLIKSSKLIKYFHLDIKGKSKSLNFAIKKAKGNILAFTDDDCLVSKDWVRSIRGTFKKNKTISLCFGKTLPHNPNSPDNIKNRFCPCTFQKKKDVFSVTNQPKLHWKDIGFGNNMAIKRNVFEKIGLFETLLGPGSIGKAAEDAEISLRAIVNNYQIGYEPTMIIYHNKWLLRKENNDLKLAYSLGGIACYAHFALLNYDFAKKIVANEFNFTVKNLINFRHLKKNQRDFNHLFNEFLCQLLGLIIAFLITVKSKTYGKIKIYEKEKASS